MMLSLSGTFMDTMSSGSNRAGIPSCVSATSKAYNETMRGKRRQGWERVGDEEDVVDKYGVERQ